MREQPKLATAADRKAALDELAEEYVRRRLADSRFRARPAPEDDHHGRAMECATRAIDHAVAESRAREDLLVPVAAVLRGLAHQLDETEEVPGFAVRELLDQVLTALEVAADLRPARRVPARSPVAEPMAALGRPVAERLKAWCRGVVTDRVPIPRRLRVQPDGVDLDAV